MLSCIPQCCSGCPLLPAAKKKKPNVMFRVHWGRLQLSQDLFQLGMEADVEKWPWEHTELSGAPQIETEASYVCKSLALGSFLSAAQPLMTKEWIRRHAGETNSNLQFCLQTVISIWEERAQATNCAWWLTFNDKTFSWQLSLYQCVLDINWAFINGLKVYNAKIHHSLSHHLTSSDGL